MAIASNNDWIKQSFLLPEGAINDSYAAAMRIYTSARGKYTDTTIGGNWAINALPAFTQFADPPRKGVYSPSEGMGPFYSEVIDDNAVLVHFSCGVPKFNSLTRFFGNFYSVDAASLARTGRANSSIFYSIGSAAGAVLALPLAPVVLVGKTIRFFFDRPSSRYYYMKRTMHSYWSAVSSMVNGIVAAQGWHPNMFTSSRGLLVDDGAYNSSDDAWGDINKALPEIFTGSGYIDIFAMSTKAQVLALAFKDELENRLVNARTYEERADLIRAIAARDKKTVMLNKKQHLSANSATLEQFINEYTKMIDGQYNREDAQNQVADSTPTTDEEYQEDLRSFGNSWSAIRHQAGEWVTFRVDNMGTQSESFNSSTKTSGIADSINSLSSNARDTRFNLADGNVDHFGVVKSLTEAVANIGAGIGSAFSVEGIAALAGSAFADIPEQWDSSTADLNRLTINIPLRAPYNHPISRLQNIIIPLCAILAMGLPLSAGPQSYTQPFLVQVFSRGRAHIRMGVIESISVTRGVGDVGWSRKGDWLGADVSITVKDLSSVLHMPISTKSDSSTLARFTQAAGGVIGSAVDEATGGSGTGGLDVATVLAGLDSSVYSDDSLYSDYIATLASIPLEDEISSLAKWAIRRRQAAMRNMQLTSPAHVASWMLSGVGGDILKAVSTRTDRDRFRDLEQLGN